MSSTTTKQSLFRSLPKVDEQLAAAESAGLLERFSRGVVLRAIRERIDETRAQIAALPDDGRSGGNGAAAAEGAPTDGAEEQADIVEAAQQAILRFPDLVADRCEALTRPSQRRVVNATGIILHTNMGRAAIADVAIDAIAEAARYTNLEIDDDTGKRSQRLRHVEGLLCELTGAEAAAVVNNNAAGTLLVLQVLTQHGPGPEVICARGQLVEIGGAFRIPDVMVQAGAVLHEIGTTNKVHPRDYEGAINERTAGIIKVHPSNYKITGFTSEVPIDEVVKIGDRHGVPVADDLGAGALIDLAQFGFDAEPLVAESVSAGCALVCMSGDKLIGASQAGIIVGPKKWIERARKAPLYRALRCDKLTLAGLEATLHLFRDRDTLLSQHPTWRMLTTPPQELRERATALKDKIAAMGAPIDATVIDGFSQLGSGSLPGQNMPTSLVALAPTTPGDSVEALAQRLRRHTTPVHTRIEHDRVLIDPRTVRPDEDEITLAAVRGAAR